MRIPGRIAVGALCAVALSAALIAAGCGSSSRFAAICKSPDEDVHATSTTGAHIFGLSVTGPEVVHTPAEVKARHIQHGGDVLVSGRYATTAVSPGGSPRHFELHICDARTGRVLAHLHPSMQVADTTLGSKPKRIVVAMMEGTGEGLNDLHYGDEVLLNGGHSYGVAVQLGRDRATLLIHLSS
jgi:hypothetical protein